MPLFSAKPPDSWDSPCREVLVSFCGISDLFLFLCGEAFLTGQLGLSVSGSACPISLTRDASQSRKNARVTENCVAVQLFVIGNRRISVTIAVHCVVFKAMHFVSNRVTGRECPRDLGLSKTHSWP